MNNIYIFVITFALAILSWGCECTVESDPKAIITPTEFANVLFINALQSDELNNLYVYSSSKYIKYLDTIYKNWETLDKEYKKVGIMVAGVKNIVRIVSVKDTNITLYNGVFNLSKDSNYTLVAYGKDKSVQTIFTKDYIKNFMSDNIYFRLFNAIADSPELIISIKTEGFEKNINLKSGNTTELFTFPQGNYTVRVLNSDSLSLNAFFDLKFSQGKMNNFILRGSIKNNDIKYGIVTAEIPR